MSSVRQIQLLIFLLVCVGLGAAAYKHIALGFPLLGSDRQTVWNIETKITFDAGPAVTESDTEAQASSEEVVVKVNMPDPSIERKVVFSNTLSAGYDFSVEDSGEVEYAHWSAKGKTGPQTIYIRSQSYFVEGPPQVDNLGDANILEPELEGVYLTAAETLLDSIDVEPATLQGRIQVVANSLNRVSDANTNLLLREFASLYHRDWVVGQVLTLAGFDVRLAQGILLEDKRRKQNIHRFIEVFDGKRWLLFDARSMEFLSWGQVIIMARGDEPLVEVFGGENSAISFSTLKEQRAAFATAVEAAQRQSNPLVDFSIYSLPVAEQNTFKMLLLIPLGALVVVILRNLVGIRTSGTFMPVLIALSFLQTTLLTGLALFLLVVGVGLVLRSYLSRLNLLLVPRIASVLVFVIIIYAFIGILSFKMGWGWGLKVTFFPMIILSWTIERMSILWDEEGAQEVFVQGGGSLLTASIAYLLMSNEVVSDTIFLFPELLLVLLAIIIGIGSYSGYRLSDLRRFEPMERL